MYCNSSCCVAVRCGLWVNLQPRAPSLDACGTSVLPRHSIGAAPTGVWCHAQPFTNSTHLLFWKQKPQALGAPISLEEVETHFVGFTGSSSKWGQGGPRVPSLKLWCCLSCLESKTSRLLALRQHALSRSFLCVRPFLSAFGCQGLHLALGHCSACDGQSWVPESESGRSQIICRSS